MYINYLKCVCPDKHMFFFTYSDKYKILPSIEIMVDSLQKFPVQNNLSLFVFIILLQVRSVSISAMSASLNFCTTHCPNASFQVVEFCIMLILLPLTTINSVNNYFHVDSYDKLLCMVCFNTDKQYHFCPHKISFLFKVRLS